MRQSPVQDNRLLPDDGTLAPPVRSATLMWDSVPQPRHLTADEMPLPDNLRNEIDDYARRDLPGDLQFHMEFFDFISDCNLRELIGQQFYTARYLYKLWEGLRLSERWSIRGGTTTSAAIRGRL